MATTQNALTSGSSATNGTSYNTAVVAPASNELVCIKVFSECVTANDDPIPSSITGNGLTWVLIDSQLVGDTFGGISWWRAMGASPSSGAITINFTDTQNGCLWNVIENGNVDTGGSSGSGAVVQSAKGNGTGTTLTVTLGAFGSANNATQGAFGAYTDTGNVMSVTPGTGFTEIYDIELDLGWKDSLASEWRVDNDTTVDVTWSQATDNCCGIAIEIKEAVAAAGNDYHYRMNQ